jgi:hypothetical protein
MIHKILLTVTLALSLAFTSYAQNTKEQIKENKKEGCSDKFNVDESNIVINNDKSFLSGYFAIRFDAKSDVPTTMKAIMKIMDCKGNVSYVSIPLVLDAKSNLWVGKFGIPQVPGCLFNVEALTLIVTNECGDEFGETSYKEKGNVESVLEAKFKKLKGSKSKGYEAF